jgi:hypothetical protein
MHINNFIVALNVVNMGKTVDSTVERALNAGQGEAQRRPPAMDSLQGLQNGGSSWSLGSSTDSAVTVALDDGSTVQINLVDLRGGVPPSSQVGQPFMMENLPEMNEVAAMEFLLGPQNERNRADFPGGMSSSSQVEQPIATQSLPELNEAEVLDYFTRLAAMQNQVDELRQAMREVCRRHGISEATIPLAREAGACLFSIMSCQYRCSVLLTLIPSYRMVFPAFNQHL